MINHTSELAVETQQVVAALKEIGTPEILTRVEAIEIRVETAGKRIQENLLAQDVVFKKKHSSLRFLLIACITISMLAFASSVAVLALMLLDGQVP